MERAKAFAALLTVILLAGCAGLFGGPSIVEDECAVTESGVIASCTVVVENPEDTAMDVEVTVETVDRSGDAVASESEQVTVSPGDTAEVSLTIPVGGTVDGYTVDAVAVDEQE